MAAFVEAARAKRPDLATAIEISAYDAGLHSCIAQNSPDLVAVGTHGRTGLRKAVMVLQSDRVAKLPWVSPPCGRSDLYEFVRCPAACPVDSCRGPIP